MPDFLLEKTCGAKVVGIDEAGRGPWAGPVVAGAVMFKNYKCTTNLLDILDDSKKLSPHKREIAYNLIKQEEQNGNLICAIGIASVEEIDSLNILQATFLAMARAYNQLNIHADTVLVDGNLVPNTIKDPCKTVIKGDAKCYSISAASICAKVFRDNYMKKIAQEYPFYGFEKNMGYGTKEHIDALNKYGICKIHRLSYKPIKEILALNNK